MPKLYVIVRKDLSPGQIIAQSVHASHAFTMKGDQDLVSDWNNGTVVILGAENEKELHLLMMQMGERDIPYKEFIEPYYNDSVTGFATIRLNKEELFKGLQLLKF